MKIILTKRKTFWVGNRESFQEFEFRDPILPQEGYAQYSVIAELVQIVDHGTGASGLYYFNLMSGELEYTTMRPVKLYTGTAW